MSKAPPKKLTRVAKGKRPYLFDDGTGDMFLSMITALTTEMMVMRDRLDTVERVASAKGVILKDEIENFAFDDAALAERAEARKALADRVYYLLLQQAERNKSGG
ncbi:MAG: hypothetical protein KDE14_10800 [Rhodobacteraceae bacterium]|nr:hypothetical protein [Paracoccaceae bacterium]